MLKTEEEARQCWCPMVSPEYLEGLPFGSKPLCIASACMAWRWADRKMWKHIDTNQTQQERPMEVTRRKFREVGRDIGYCGLAGKS